MDSKYCSGCYQKRPLSSFAKNGSTGRLLASCAPCCTSQAKSNTKRKALQPLDPNIPPPKRRAAAYTHSKSTIPPPNPPASRLEATIPPPNPPESRLGATIPPNPPALRSEATIPPNLLESRPETLIPIPTPPLIQPQAPGFLPADQ
jgi:hypothetical protein